MSERESLSLSSGFNFSPPCVCFSSLYFFPCLLLFLADAAELRAREMNLAPVILALGEKAALCDYDECAAAQCVIYLSGLSQAML